ncbi:HAD family hydrolase [Actinotalea sp.]|uniref:HAD family hydrolase n=1 Tax=Actinotalea sp. TaxID=1872145 RepID=UPI00356B2339
MRPRLVATDLDGTLLDAAGRLSSRTARVLDALAQARIEVLFVTARPPRWLDDLVSAVSGHGTVVCLNGALVIDVATGSELESHPLAGALVRELLTDLRSALPGARFAAERSTGLAVERGFPPRGQLPRGTPVAELLEDLLDDTTGKLLARFDVPDGDLGSRVAEVLAGRALVADSGAVGLAEITAPGVTKAAALARWATARGIAAQEVWAFGDMPNDLEMLRWAGRACAVANAHPAVLAVADVVCGPHDEDGVAAYLEQTLLAVRD